MLLLSSTFFPLWRGGRLDDKKPSVNSIVPKFFEAPLAFPQPFAVAAVAALLELEDCGCDDGACFLFDVDGMLRAFCSRTKEQWPVATGQREQKQKDGANKTTTQEVQAKEKN
jgi:hypothetical protein